MGMMNKYMFDFQKNPAVLLQNVIHVLLVILRTESTKVATRFAQQGCKKYSALFTLFGTRMLQDSLDAKVQLGAQFCNYSFHS